MNAMKAEKQKANTAANKKGKISVRPPSATKKPEGADQIEEQLAKVWAEEVIALQAQRFTTVEAALGAVVTQVVKRMSGDDEMKEFLTFMCETDPDMLDSLRELLVRA